jgi:hypothetical protein
MYSTDTQTRALLARERREFLGRDGALAPRPARQSFRRLVGESFLAVGGRLASGQLPPRNACGPTVR